MYLLRLSNTINIRVILVHDSCSLMTPSCLKSVPGLIIKWKHLAIIAHLMLLDNIPHGRLGFSSLSE